jgi:NADPH:quinone reductase-like Zn-dependent oxidoreductase
LQGGQLNETPGPKEVLIRMRAASLNYRDLVVATVSMVGFLSGLTIPEYDVSIILQKAATVRGSQVGNRDHFEKMNRAITHHALHPVIDRVFPLDRIGEAFALLAEGKQYFGKIVFQI